MFSMFSKEGMIADPQGWGVIPRVGGFIRVWGWFVFHFTEYSTGNKKKKNSEDVMLSVMILFNCNRKKYTFFGFFVIKCINLFSDFHFTHIILIASQSSMLKIYQHGIRNKQIQKMLCNHGTYLSLKYCKKSNFGHLTMSHRFFF